jgi:predicted N-formylglutamate amidohydrolase
VRELTGYAGLSIDFQECLKMHLVEISFSCRMAVRLENMCMNEMDRDRKPLIPEITGRLLGHDEPSPVVVERAGGASPMLLIADHAGNLVPRSLQQLGLPEAELGRHIGIDIGILGVCRKLSDILDATLIHQRYSRLVIDCNRHPQYDSAFAAVSDQTSVPGNARLTVPDAARRITEIFLPYHAKITRELDRRQDSKRPVALIAMHSFTPQHKVLRAARPWPIAILFNRDNQIAHRLITSLRDEAGLNVGVNEPYKVDDESDYAIPVHGEKRGVPCVEIEIRQDLITAAQDQLKWANLLAPILRRAVDEVLASP